MEPQACGRCSVYPPIYQNPRPFQFAQPVVEAVTVIRLAHGAVTIVPAGPGMIDVIVRVLVSPGTVTVVIGAAPVMGTVMVVI